MTYLTKLMERFHKTPQIETVPPQAPADKPVITDVPPAQDGGAPTEITGE